MDTHTPTTTFRFAGDLTDLCQFPLRPIEEISAKCLVDGPSARVIARLRLNEPGEFVVAAGRVIHPLAGGGDCFRFGQMHSTKIGGKCGDVIRVEIAFNTPFLLSWSWGLGVFRIDGDIPLTMGSLNWCVSEFRRIPLWALLTVGCVAIFISVRATAPATPSVSYPSGNLFEVVAKQSHDVQRDDPLESSTTAHQEIANTDSGATDTYDRDVAAIRRAVIADTIDSGSARFCPRFEVINNNRGRRVYVGWYTSRDLRGRTGKDNIIAEVSDDGRVVQLDIGAP